MTTRVSRFITTAFAAVLVLGAHPARAELLLYDGFATVTDAQNRTPYLNTEDTHKLQSNNAKGHAWTTGVTNTYPWSETSAVVFTFRNNGLSLPAAFADGTGDQFAARGGSVGWLNSSYSAQIRGKNRKITSAMPTSGTLYYRCLMKIEANAFTRMKEATDRYAAAGLTCRAAENKYDNGYTMAQTGFRVYFIGTGSTVALKFGVGKGDGNGTVANTLVASVTADTTYLCIVGIDYDTGKACAYVTPIADYTKTFSWTVENVDASGITGAAVQTMFVDGIYQTNSGKVMFDEIAAGTKLSDVAVIIPATAPVLGDASLARTGALTYEVAAEEEENTADTMSWIADDGSSAPATNAFATAVAAGTTATDMVSGLAANKTWQISVLAENASGTDEKTAGVFYSGELALGATTDANEYNCVPGGVVVSRASADPFPLVVNYTISGSDGTEGTTWAAPTAVTIPANAASAILPVVPLMDGDVMSNITITVTLAQGNYELPTSSSATLTLVNLAPPAGKKTWVAVADGLASDGANWLPAGAPTASDDILLDGNFSNARCTWDAAVPAVNSWEQTSSFTGTVDFYTTYEGGDFPVFAVAGDCIVNGGKWTHRANAAVQTNRLSVTIGGDFTVANGVEITASTKGFSQNHFPAGAALGVHGGSVNDTTKVYGDFRHPVDLGAGGGSQGMSGGGAIHIVVAGAATVNGLIAARPNQGGEESAQLGAGGSIYLQAASVSGSGTGNCSITVAGWGSDNCTRQDGAGGRIAIVCTEATELAFPTAYIRSNGSVGGYGRSSGGGTVFIKTASQLNGTLLVVNSTPSMTYVRWWPTKRGVTPIPTNETWTLDAIEFRGMGVLCVPEGASLSVPISGISSSSTREAGILYEGGTLDFGSAPYTLTGNWTFQADEPYTFDGDVTVTGGANIGGLKFSGHYTNDFAKCDVTVNGNLTIAGDGYATVELAGPNESGVTAANGGQFPMHGGQYAGLSGNRCYDSVFNPVYPGHFARCGDQGTFGVGGGALKLTVTGDLVVDGRISADGTVRYKSSAAAGSVNIRANTLSGTGSITATGKKGSIQWDNGYNGTGGRVAVRVTGEDIGTTGVWTKFAALGVSTNEVVANGAVVTDDRNQNTSAGTIYLQGASDGEKGGTIYVKNQASYDTSNVATWIPSAARGDEAADFKKAKLVVADRGVVAIAADIKFASVSVAANSKLDLHGQKVKTTAAWLGGDKLAPGTYTAANAAVSDFVADSAGGGELIVSGQGTFLFVQ